LPLPAEKMHLPVFIDASHRFNLMGALPAFACSLAAVGQLGIGLRIWKKHGRKYNSSGFLLHSPAGLLQLNIFLSWIN
jgi:hypothetical protein